MLLSSTIPRWAIFSIFVFCVVCIASIWALVYWWKKDNHTREKFAFLGATSLISFVTLLITQIKNESSFPIIIVNLIASIFGKTGYSYQPKALSPFETMIDMILIVSLGVWFLNVFKCWNGQKSKAQYEQEQNRVPPSIISDIRLFLTHDKEKRKKLEPHQEQGDALQTMLEGAKDTRAWHEQARQLLLLRRREYLFNNPYDLERKCWWGEERYTGALVCLACFLDMPSEKEIMELANYMKTYEWDRKAIDEIIVACKNVDSNFEPEHRNGFVLYKKNQVELLDKLVDFSDYFDDICKRIRNVTLPDSALTLEKTYTPSRYRLKNHKIEETHDLESFIFDWLEENSTRQLALLGEYGQGKSTISLLISYKLIERAKSNPKIRIPILLELRGKSPRTLSPEELLATWASRYGIAAKALLQLLIAGRLVLIFEGFDEIDLTGDSDTRLNHFQTLWRLSYPQAKILITGRPNFFLDDNERKSALGIEAPHPTRPYCQEIFLAPFSLSQIEDSLRSTEEKTRNEIIELSKQNQKFYEIISRPSLLFIVSTLWKRENLSEKREKISSALVIDLFIRHSYRRPGIVRTEQNGVALNTAERAYFMSGIAAYMAVKELPNQITKYQLDEAINCLVNIIPDDVSRNVGTNADEIRLPLRHSERFYWEHRRAEVLEHIKTDVRACGILVTDLSKDGTFKFAHKSFMEFLQAQLISQLYVYDKTTHRSAISIINTLGGNISHLGSSPEILSFLVELLRDGIRYSDAKKKDDAVAKILFDIFLLGDLNKNNLSSCVRRYLLRIHLEVLNLFPKAILNKFGLELFSSPMFFAMGSIFLAANITYLISDKGVEISNQFLAVLVGISLVFIGAVFAFTGAAIAFSGGLGRRTFSLTRRLEFWFDACKNLGLSNGNMAIYLGGTKIVAFLEDRKISRSTITN